MPVTICVIMPGESVVQVDLMDALFAESRDDPPLYKNQTPVAGAIHWEKSLFHRMKRTVLRFMTLEAMMQTDQGKAVSRFLSH